MLQVSTKNLYCPCFYWQPKSLNYFHEAQVVKFTEANHFSSTIPTPKMLIRDPISRETTIQENYEV